MNEFINKLPGYSAQNATFGFMIGFLMIISLVIIAVFFVHLDDAGITDLCRFTCTGNSRTCFGDNDYQSVVDFDDFWDHSGWPVGRSDRFINSCWRPDGV